MIFEVIGKATPASEETPLFSAEATSVPMMDTLLVFYKHMGLIPGAETFEITSVVPNGKKHQYHIPRPLITYAINSYRSYLAKQNPSLARLTSALLTV